MPTPARAAALTRRAWTGLGPGTQRLVLVCVGLTVLFSVATHFFVYPFLPAGGALVQWPSDWMVVHPGTLPEFRLTALATSGLIAAPTGLLGLIILGLIIAYFMQDQVRHWWRTRRAALVGVPLAVLLVAGVADQVLLPGGFASGLLSSVVVLGWIGASLERIWGTARFLRFAATVLLGSHLLGALVLWIWPSAYGALLGGGALPTFGTQPLVGAMLAVQGFMIGERRLSVLPFNGRHLVILLIAIGVLDMLMRGAAAGLIQLSAIGIAWLLIRGLWRPRYLIDRVRLYFIDRRLARRRRKITVIDGGRAH